MTTATPERKDALTAFAQAVGMSAHIFTREPDQMAAQLYGRLVGSGSALIQDRIRAGAAGYSKPWLQLLSASLTPPGEYLQRTLTSDGGFLTALAIASDGKVIFAAGRNGSIRSWGVATGRQIADFRRPQHAVHAFARTPDGCHAAAGYEDGQLLIWDLTTGSLDHDIKAHEGKITDAAHRPFHSEILTCSVDGRIIRWDIRRGEERQTIEPIRRSGSLTTLAVTRDGHVALAGTSQGFLEIWDLERGKLTYNEQIVDYGAVHQFSVSPDNRTLLFRHDRPTRAVATRNTVTLFDLARQKTRTLSVRGRPQSCAFLPDGSRILVGLQDGALALLNAAGGGEVSRFHAHPGAITCIAVAPDGRHAVTGGKSQTLRVWDLEGPSRAMSADAHTGAVTCIAAAAGADIAVSAGQDRVLKSWDAHSGACFQTSPAMLHEPVTVAINADGTLAAAGSRKEFVIWHRDNQFAGGHGRVGNNHHVALTPDGHKAISGSTTHVNIWDLVSGEMLLSHRHLNDPGRLLKDVELLQALAGQAAQDHLQARTSLLLALGFMITPDGRTAVPGSSLDGALERWDVEHGRRRDAIPGPGAPIKTVATGRDGPWVYSGDVDGIIAVWDVKGGKLQTTWQAHAGAVACLTLTGDGAHLVSAGDDDTIRIWDLHTRRQITAFTTGAAIQTCELTRTGDTLVLGDGMGKVHFLRFHRGKHRTIDTAHVPSIRSKPVWPG